MVDPQATGGDAEAASHRPEEDPGGISDAAAKSAAAANADPNGSCVLLGPPAGGEWLGREHRRLERYPVQASRPIAVRLLDADGQPKGLWFLADILDISRGGLCLLVSGPMQLPGAQRLQLDVRCHPDFGRHRLESEVRWCRSSISFTTLGLAFLELLPKVPRLELERRTTRRDPNEETWAQES